MTNSYKQNQILMKNQILLALLVGICTMTQAQFHTLKMPQASPAVTETQQLGITNITVDYSSPAVNGRKVYETVVPKNGDPIPWRAGANVNTKITFSTDVLINGKPLPAGTYGFHTIPSEGDWTLLFAHASEQWGSYYLDRHKDVSLEVTATPADNPFSENLNYTFENRTDSTVEVAIAWENLRIPFTVEVDLNATVLNSLRSELRGVNTYHWQAWSDAAQWCLSRNTNMEEALTWINRSIDGGYGGFASNKNMTNLSLKSDILYKMGDEKSAEAILQEALTFATNADEMYGSGMSLLRNKRTSEAVDVFALCTKKYPQVWYPYLGQARALSQVGDFKQAVKAIDKALSMAPDKYPQDYRPYLTTQKEKLLKKEVI
jgi:hypothetical protein